MTTARDRLSSARATHARLERQIAAATEARKRALLGDDDRVAAELDREIIDLKLALQRCADKIELLGPVLIEEERDAAWPYDPVRLQALIEKEGRELRKLQARPAIDRSAAEDNRIDHLRVRVPSLQKRLRDMETFAARTGYEDNPPEPAPRITPSDVEARR